MSNIIDINLFEVRYKPNSKMLDYRGAWADAINSVMNYQHWRIDNNRIDVKDENGKHSAFVSFNNAGLSIKNAATKNYFPDHAIKFMKVLFELEGFELEPYIERIGVRSRFCTKFDGDFKTLLDKYSSRFVILTEPAKDILKSKLLDIGSPLVLEDDIGKINLMGGPMDTRQIKQFFEITDDDDITPPDVGLVFDIDYWNTPKSIMKENDLIESVKIYSNACWAMHDKLKTLVLS